MKPTVEILIDESWEALDFGEYTIDISRQPERYVSFIDSGFLGEEKHPKSSRSCWVNEIYNFSFAVSDEFRRRIWEKVGTVLDVRVMGKIYRLAVVSFHGAKLHFTGGCRYSFVENPVWINGRSYAWERVSLSNIFRRFAPVRHEHYRDD